MSLVGCAVKRWGGAGEAIAPPDRAAMGADATVRTKDGWGDEQFTGVWLRLYYLGRARPDGKHAKNCPVDNPTAELCQGGRKGLFYNGLTTTRTTMAIIRTVGTSFMRR